jgi:HEAT repeat protein
MCIRYSLIFSVIFCLNLTVLSAQDAPTRPAKAETQPSAQPAEKKKMSKEEFERESEKKKAEWIGKTMDYGIQKDRKDAINLIPTVKDDSVRKPLEEKLVVLLGRESDSTILVKSIGIAAELKLTAAVPVIRKYFTHDSEDVRIAAVYAIKDLKATETKAELIELLQKQDFAIDSNFTEAMIQTLSDFEAVEIKDLVIEKIKNNKTSRNIRLALILFLGRSGARESREFLITIYKDPNEDIEVRSYCVNSMAKLDIKEAIPEINKVLEEYDGYTFNKKKQYNTLYLYSISALVKLGDEKAYFRLVDALKSDNATTRLRAVKLIKDLKDKRSIDILTYKMQYDPSMQVQKAAREALKEMGVDVKDDTPPSKTKTAQPAPKKDAAPAEGDVPSEERVQKRDDF